MSAFWVVTIVLLPMNVVIQKVRSDVTDPGTHRPWRQRQELQQQAFQHPQRRRRVAQYHNKRCMCHLKFTDTIHRLPMKPLNTTDIMNTTAILHRVILDLREMCREPVLVSVADVKCLFDLSNRTRIMWNDERTSSINS